MRILAALFALAFSLNSFAYEVGDMISLTPTKIGELPTLPQAPEGTVWKLVNLFEKAPPVYEYRLVKGGWSKVSPFPTGDFSGFVSTTLKGHPTKEEDYSSTVSESKNVVAVESATMETVDQYRFTSTTQFEVLNPNDEVIGKGSCEVVTDKPTVCEIKLATSFLVVERLIVITKDGSMEVQDLIKTNDGQEQTTFIFMERN